MELNEEFINSLELDPIKILKTIAEDLSIQINKVNATVNLIKEGNTIPFISRYRKEVMGNLDEIQVRDISHKLTYTENMETRRIEIIKGIFSQGKLTEDLYQNIMKSNTQTELEDLYAPFKKKKKTRGMLAIERGLEELSILMKTVKDIEKEAERFINAEKGVETVEDALKGAMDILAEKVSQDVDNRKLIRDFIIGTGEIIVKGLKDEASSVYKMYYDYKEPLKQLKPHRVLAINRGEKEEELEAIKTKLRQEFSEELTKIKQNMTVVSSNTNTTSFIYLKNLYELQLPQLEPCRLFLLSKLLFHLRLLLKK